VHLAFHYDVLLLIPNFVTGNTFYKSQNLYFQVTGTFQYAFKDHPELQASTAVCKMTLYGLENWGSNPGIGQKHVSINRI
jgi:hypothetical protein